MDVEIRRAGPEDLQSMASLWLENMALQQLGDRRVRLAQDSVECRVHALQGWLQDLSYCVLVALASRQVAGYIVGCERPGPAGMLPERQGHMLELTVGLHTDMNGLGGRLWPPLQNWFRQRGLEEIIVHVPLRQPVEQAFWRSMGAIEMTGMFWMKS